MRFLIYNSFGLVVEIRDSFNGKYRIQTKTEIKIVDEDTWNTIPMGHKRILV